MNDNHSNLNKNIGIVLERLRRHARSPLGGDGEVERDLALLDELIERLDGNIK